MRKALGSLFFLVMAISVATLPARADGYNYNGYDGYNGDKGYNCDPDPVSAPEPATFALLASGMGALAMFRRSLSK